MPGGAKRQRCRCRDKVLHICSHVALLESFIIGHMGKELGFEGSRGQSFFWSSHLPDGAPRYAGGRGPVYYKSSFSPRGPVLRPQNWTTSTKQTRNRKHEVVSREIPIPPWLSSFLNTPHLLYSTRLKRTAPSDERQVPRLGSRPTLLRKHTRFTRDSQLNH